VSCFIRCKRLAQKRTCLVSFVVRDWLRNARVLFRELLTDDRNSVLGLL